MKRELGISIYPDNSDLEKDQAYISKAGQLGFSRVFMSMLEIKEDKEKVFKKFKTIIEHANSFNMEVILDISPSIFSQLGITYEDLSFFSDLGAAGIRLDEGFDGSREALISYNKEGLIIELNMSNDVAYLENILSYQANEPFIYGCHNFYPQRGTGLPYDFFMKCSERFKKKGIKTSAFVTSSKGTLGPWNVNDGLPTLEIHRDMPMSLQANHLFATGLIDTVIVGNAYATDDELEQMAKIDKYKLEIGLEVNSEVNEVERKILEEFIHIRRGDITENVIRSTQSRVTYSNESNTVHDNDGCFEVGDVVIGNDTFGKYRNELQIVLVPHKDERKNLVGKIATNELFLLDYIKPWSKFSFKII